MKADWQRYGRQIRLAEIGEAGQAKLCASSVPLSSVGFARTIEALYVRGAGMSIRASHTEQAAPPPPAAPDLGFRHEAARDVASGAWFALAELRSALALGSET